MKKITLLLTLLLCVAGTAWAQITAVSELNNTTAYTIKSAGRGFIYWATGEGFDVNYLTSSYYRNETDATPEGSANQQFAFLRGTNTETGKYYLYCIAANKFVGQESGTVKLKLYDNPTETVTLTKVETYFVIKFSNGNSINITNWQAHQGCKVTTTGPDPGNKMTITSVAEELDLATAVAAIDTYENNAAQTEVTTAKTNALDVIAKLKTAYYYTKSATAIQTAEDAVNSVDLALVTPANKTVTLTMISGAIADLYASASENPLTNGAKIVLNNRLYPNNYPAVNATGDGMIRGNENNYPAVWEVEMKDEANGVFYLKNPYTGKYASRYQGSASSRYTLAATQATAGSFKILNEAAQEGFVAFQPQEGRDGTALSGTTANTQCYIHLDGWGNVVAWSAATGDKGSHFLVQAVSEDDITAYETTARTNLENALAAVDEAPSNYTIGTDLGEYQVKDKTAAQAVYDNNAATACELDQATASITPAVTINQPQVGKLYRFKPWNSTKYISAETTAGTKAVLRLKEGYDWQSVIFQLCENGKILSFGNGTYMTDANYSGTVGSSAGNNMVFDASPTHKGYYTIRSTTADRYLYNSGSSVNRNTEYAADYCDWKIEEVTWLPININEPYNVGTIYSPVALNKDLTRLKFYTGKVNGSELVLTEYTEDVIPANVPFVVVKQNDTPTNGCMFFEINKTANPTFDGTNNHLQGQYESFAKGENSYYTLQPAWDENGANHNSATDVAFRLFDGTNVQGFRAYLPANLVTGTSLSIRFEGEDDITGIDNTLTNANGKQEIFDLTGRRVSRATKGLYIINGQKVLVK